VNARGLAASHGETLRAFLGRLAFVELSAPVLERALEPFPVPVRTLDALHLASALFLRAQGQAVRLATYDDRLARAARGVGLDVYA
jgi:predicted nucleic acid-binding protein